MRNRIYLCKVSVMYSFVYMRCQTMLSESDWGNISSLTLRDTHPPQTYYIAKDPSHRDKSFGI